jgi:hypothetical protein
VYINKVALQGQSVFVSPGKGAFGMEIWSRSMSRWGEVKDVADAGYSREIRGGNFSEPNGLPEVVQDCMPVETTRELHLCLNSEDALSG